MAFVSRSVAHALRHLERTSRNLSAGTFSSGGGELVGHESTIYALATGGTRCGLAVIRVSGSQSRHVMQTIARFSKPPEPRKAILRTFYDPACTNDMVLDTGMVLWFPEPKSYTGQDTCEFIVHGGLAVISAFLKCISSFDGCRMAQPGEFTKRAFLNGKIRNLTEIDALHDLITAETELQRAQAVRQMRGSLGNLYESWKDEISQCLAFAEAYIDFGEDENIEHDILETVNARIVKVRDEIKLHLADGRKGERLRNGVTVTIAGKPNTGKSSLLNILCRRKAAIVSDIPGTTRDVIEATINLGGYPVILADTAGLRESVDVIESEGIQRAQEYAEKSDILIAIIDWISFKESTHASRLDLVKEQLSHLIPAADEAHKNSLSIDDLMPKVFLVLNKIDLCEGDTDENLFHTFDSVISCRTSERLDEFLNKLTERVASMCANPKAEAAYLTQERYRVNLQECLTHLENYLICFSSDLALKTNHLKNGIKNIGAITGHVGTEDILDIIFRDFCIGK